MQNAPIKQPRPQQGSAADAPVQLIFRRTEDVAPGWKAAQNLTMAFFMIFLPSRSSYA